MTLRELCELMITVSSNFAANLLIERLGVENIRRTVTSLGADGMQVLRGVEDQKAFDKGMNNTTTARGLMVLLDKLAHGRAVGRGGDTAMIEILEAAEVQRRDPGRRSSRHVRRAQDRQHHPHPSRRGHRLCAAPVRAGAVSYAESTIRRRAPPSWPTCRVRSTTRTPADSPSHPGATVGRDVRTNRS